MKILFPVTLILLSCTSGSVKAASERFVTVTVPGATNNPSTGFWAVTNKIEIAEGETGELITHLTYNNPQPQVTVTKDGIEFFAVAAGRSSANSPGTTVAGPATFTMFTYTDYGPLAGSPGLMSVRITPKTYAVEKTVTVAPGMGVVQVAMESSTNLVQWVTATNGAYSDDLKFFRIRLTKTGP